ncbi:MAG: glycosyltransferase [Paludibacter sp.]
MSKKIILLNTGHYSLDDRVFYHLAKSLSNFGYEILIISTKEDLVCCIDNIQIKSYSDSKLSHKEKVVKIVESLNEFMPDIVICDSPISIIASSIFKRKCKTKIIYDLTEWYPSKKNFRFEQGFKKIRKFIVLVLFNLFAGIKTDGFIFGEHYKSLPFRFLFFWKPFEFLPYYPDLTYIENYPIKQIDTQLNLFYSGIINVDKGIDALINAIDIASKLRPNLQFNLQIIGYFPSPSDQVHFTDICSNLAANVIVDVQNKLDFLDFCKVIGKSDLFFDLRIIDLENTFCMPIKLFYYLACGRPVIYSKLRSIKKEIKNFNYGYLCYPNDSQQIAMHIIDYIENPEIYIRHANNALDISKSKYNWKVIENDFLVFIDKF